MPTTKLYIWDPKALCWRDDPYQEVEALPRPIRNTNLYVGGDAYDLDIPDGRYDDGSEHILRATMECPHVDLLRGFECIVLEGFVSWEDFDFDGGTPIPYEGWRKERWEVRR